MFWMMLWLREQNFRSVRVCWTQTQRRRMLLICWVSWSVTLRILQLLSHSYELEWNKWHRFSTASEKTKQKGDKLQTVMRREEFWVLLNLSCRSLKTLKQNRTLIDGIDHTCVYTHSVTKGLWSKCCGCGGHLAAGGVEMVRKSTASWCLLPNYTGCASGDCSSLRTFWLTEG